MRMTAAPWLRQAWPELGQFEVKGGRDNTRIMRLYRDSGHAEIRHDEVPWCAAFVGAVLARDGYKPSGSLMARSYLKWGRTITEAQFGAVTVLSRGRNPAHGHVGFLVGETKDRIWLLGGNQSDGVTVSSYPKSRLIGFRLPPAKRSPEETSLKPVDRVVDVSRLPENVFAHILDVEGGYTNDPADPGGPTNKGITLAVLAKWMGKRVSTTTRARLINDLKLISDVTVRQIYEEKYWRPSHAGEFSPALALMHFDAAVNHGVGTAIRFLQEAVRTDIDGEIGPNTRAAVARQDLDTTLSRYAGIRRKRYRRLHHFWRFGRGWLARVDKTLKRARALSQKQITENLNPERNPSTHQESGMSNTTISPTGTKWWGHSLTIWGAIVTAAATVLPVVGPLIGWDISAELVKVAGQQLVHVAQALAGLFGTLMTVYERARANKPLTQVPVTFQF